MARRKSSPEPTPPAEADYPVCFDELLGHAAQVRFLVKALGRGVLPQTLLFTGPKGIGKATLARMVAAALQCDAPVHGACGHCGPCRKVRRGIHPDVRWVGLETRDGGAKRTQIVVDQIREQVLAPLSLPPYEGRRLVILIDPADALNPNAQNALLKSLEEPPAFGQFILVTSNPAALLPTVRSRSHALTLGPLPPGDMIPLLDRLSVPPADRPSALAFACGAPGRLLSAGPGWKDDRRDLLLRLLEEGLDASVYPDLAPLLERLAKEDAGEVCALAAGLIRDALRVAHGRSALVNADAGQPLARAARRRGVNGLQRVAERLAEAPQHLARNVNPRLLLERLFLVP
ncbi:MAG: ATP-binding protein [Acidobacteriota bacterium]